MAKYRSDEKQGERPRDFPEELEKVSEERLDEDERKTFEAQAWDEFGAHVAGDKADAWSKADE